MNIADAIRRVDPGERFLKEIRDVFGVERFRPLQADAIIVALLGRDLLAVMPTGHGKSLCYQGPAVFTGTTTVVVSPLIALMDDQVSKLQDLGIAAECIHSGQHPRVQDETMRRFQACACRLLYVSPERIMQPAFIAAITKLKARDRLTAFVIDEAHCISQWGHDFRPAYGELGKLRLLFPDIPIQAFTASATPQVRTEIVDKLSLRDPVTLIGDMHRPNLRLNVEPREKDVADQIANLIGLRHGHDGAAIIYCIRRRDTEELCDRLIDFDIGAAAYHAGLDQQTRSSVQSRFMSREINVVCATVAFGMGLDRSDVRYVIHGAMPSSIEQYHQEIGRAGRDGKPAQCVMFADPEDVDTWHGIFVHSETMNDAKHDKLDEMAAFTFDLDDCRHAALCEYFGQPWTDSNCNACDVCREALAEQALLSDRE